MLTPTGQDVPPIGDDRGRPRDRALPETNRPCPPWTEWLVLAGVAACIVGFVTHRTFAALSWPRLVDLIVCSGLSLALAWPILRWLNASWAAALAAIWLAAAIAFCGIRAFAAVLLVAASGAALGSIVVPADTRFRCVLVLPVGLAMLAGIDGWLLPLPVHRLLFYVPVLVGLCIWRRVELRAITIGIARGLRNAVAMAPIEAAFAVVVLGLASTGTWLPTMQFDDLAYHLGLPSQLLRNGTYALEPGHQIWTLAPWLADVLQGIVEVLTGREARGAVNALWIVVAAASSWSVSAALRSDARICWITVALFASQPLLASLAAGMQTELATSALALSMALAVLREEESSLDFVKAILAGGLVGLKFGALAVAVILCAWSFLRMRPHIGHRSIVISLVLFTIIAGSSYGYAAFDSGNPFLPLFNNVFHSSVLPARQLDDLRWHAGFLPTLPWSITFDTDRYFECWKGGFGFTLVALAGAWLLAIIAPGRQRGIAIAATLTFVVPLVPIQYARYAFPGLTLLLPVLLAVSRAAIGSKRMLVMVSALCVLNLAFQANANTLLKSSARRQLVKGAAKEAVFRQFAPERALIATLRARDDDDSIVLALDPGTPAIAELAGRGRCVAWYDPETSRRRVLADSDSSGESWRKLIVDTRARWLLSRPTKATEALRNGLDRVHAERVATAGAAELWIVPNHEVFAGGDVP
jgi:hypothetical protein